jgi:hypothetical protein
VKQRRKYTGDDRQWEKDKVTDSSLDAEQQAILLAVVEFAHDVFEGRLEDGNFIESAKRAMIHGNASVWQNTTGWIRKVSAKSSNVSAVWDDLANNSGWQVRWRVACVLYHDIPDSQSDRIFSVLRYDKSNRVRETAVDRYENRPGPDRYVVFKMFDASDPASPGYDRSINVH